MLNVVIVEDNKAYRIKLYDIVNSFLDNYKMTFNVKTFKGYTDALVEFVNKKKDGHTIYILDICLDENGSGTDIANDIRKIDQDSIIIITTGKSLLIPEAQKLRLNILDYVSKQINFEENIRELLKVSCNIFNLKKSIKFSSMKHDYNIKNDEILYIKFNKFKRKTIIRTLINEYEINKPLSFFEIQINDDYLKISRGCIVNFSNVREVDYSSYSIIFQNNVVLKNIITISSIKMIKKYMKDIQK